MRKAATITGLILGLALGLYPLARAIAEPFVIHMTDQPARRNHLPAGQQRFRASSERPSAGRSQSPRAPAMFVCGRASGGSGGRRPPKWDGRAIWVVGPESWPPSLR